MRVWSAINDIEILWDGKPNWRYVYQFCLYYSNSYDLLSGEDEGMALMTICGMFFSQREEGWESRSFNNTSKWISSGTLLASVWVICASAISISGIV